MDLLALAPSLLGKSTGYNVVVFLHVLCVIIGFGGVLLLGVHAQVARASGPNGVYVIRAMNKASGVAEKFIFLVPIFGIGAVMMSDKYYEFSQSWVSLSIILYLIALVVSQGIIMPTSKKMEALATEMLSKGPGEGGGPPPEVAQMQAMGKKVGMASGIAQLMFLIVLFLMIWKPGVG